MRRRVADRRGSILPMLGVCLIGLFGFVGLAVDLGMLAVSRTQSQNGADVAALVGTRTLNNKDNTPYSNLPDAVGKAITSATANPHLSSYFSSSQVTKIEAGQYTYDTVSQSFRVTNWTTVGGSGGGSAMTSPATGSWTAMRVTLGVSQPTYFMRLFGITTMPSGALATAVYRPRDIAFVLDVTGSMAFASTFNYNNQSMNPDPLVPTAGHYYGVQSQMVATADLAQPSGEAMPRNNFTVTTPGGPPIARSYYYDPTNLSSPSTPAYPLTTKADGSPNTMPAFHRWNPPESGGNPATSTAVTYNFAGYNPLNLGNEASPMGPTPAPDTYGSMTDGVVTYTGDRWRRRTGAIDKTTLDWSSGNNQAAYNAADLLGYTLGTNPPTFTPAPSTPFANGWTDFRDPVWEKYGYDLNITKYKAYRGTGVPSSPTAYLAAPMPAGGGGVASNLLVPTADRFQGYSMGPGYWGKTFYMWPPDPRWGNPVDPSLPPLGTGVNPANPSAANPTVDVLGNYICDWRRRFFFDRNGTVPPSAPNTQSDNNLSATGTDSVNEVVLNTGTSGMTINSAAVVNYAAILKWLKTGPQTLPPNLRAGRVLYYSSIPDDVNTATATGQAQLDKAFWKAYIDYVLGTGSYTSTAGLYGGADSWSASAASIGTADLGAYQFSWDLLGTEKKLPYLRYTDSPRRPRLHLWFGPLSMMDFLSSATAYNWTAGTVYEAQSWQLKAGVNAVLNDVKNNHPNDLSGLVYFSTTFNNGVRIPLSTNYKQMQNALFYPRTLVDQITAGDMTTEYRPYSNTSLGGYTPDIIPNAYGGTDPCTGLGYAFNLLSPSTISAATAVGAGNGRRGSQKIVIFETDGVPNNYRVPTFNPRGYNSYYTLGGVIGGANGDATGIGYAYSVIQQMVKPMATTSTTSGAGADSGLSLPNAPTRVYPIAFGDLFDPVLAPGATFRPTAQQFLANCAAYGNTGVSGATALPDTQVITGTYDQRITRLRDCLERIFQSGVSVVLIE